MLGFPHPDYLLEFLTAQQWADWLEFYALEPFGFPVDDLRHGLLCATVVSPYMPKGRPADPRDYMLRRPPPQELTPAETVAFFRAALGGGAKKG